MDCQACRLHNYSDFSADLVDDSRQGPIISEESNGISAVYFGSFGGKRTVSCDLRDCHCEATECGQGNLKPSKLLARFAEFMLSEAKCS